MRKAAVAACPWHVMKTCTGAGCCSDIFIITFIVCSLHPKTSAVRMSESPVENGSQCGLRYNETGHIPASLDPYQFPFSTSRATKDAVSAALHAVSQSVMLRCLKPCVKGTDLTRVHVRWKYSTFACVWLSV